MIAAQALSGGKACVHGRSTMIDTGSMISAPAVSWPVVTLSGDTPCGGSGGPTRRRGHS